MWCSCSNVSIYIDIAKDVQDFWTGVECAFMASSRPCIVSTILFTCTSCIVVSFLNILSCVFSHMCFIDISSVTSSCQYCFYCQKKLFIVSERTFHWHNDTCMAKVLSDGTRVECMTMSLTQTLNKPWLATSRNQPLHLAIVVHIIIIPRMISSSWQEILILVCQFRTLFHIATIHFNQRKHWYRYKYNLDHLHSNRLCSGPDPPPH